MRLWNRLRTLWQKEERWSLSCDFHNWTLHDLTESEARVILEILRDAEKAGVMVWRTGWGHWRSLRDPDCAVLLHTRIVKLRAPALPQSSESFDPEITAVRSIATSNPFSSRKHTRFEVRYPIKLLTGTHEFTTETEDLSEGGMKVRDAIPDWVGGYCSVTLHVEDGKQLEVLCSLAEDQKGKKTRLEIVDSDKRTAFTEWFIRRFQVS